MNPVLLTNNFFIYTRECQLNVNSLITFLALLHTVASVILLFSRDRRLPVSTSSPPRLAEPSQKGCGVCLHAVGALVMRGCTQTHIWGLGDEKRRLGSDSIATQMDLANRGSL